MAMYNYIRHPRRIYWNLVFEGKNKGEQLLGLSVCRGRALFWDLSDGRPVTGEGEG
jgi:hypothetical protein